MPPDREQNPGARDDGLERELRDLGARLDYPPTPDLAHATRRRIEEGEQAPRRGSPWASRPSLRWVAAAALVLMLAVPTLSPGVRSAVSDFLLMGGMAGSASGGAQGGAGGGAETAEQEGVAESGQQAASGTAASGAAGAAGGGVGVAGGEETLASAGSGAQMAGAASAGASDERMESEDLAASGGGGAGNGGGRNDRPVPDVVGMRAAAACRELAAGGYAGYVVKTAGEARIGPGRVVSQRPEAGRRGVEGGAVDLTVSEPFSAEDIRRGSRRGGPDCVDATQ